MKICRFNHDRLGLVEDDSVVDISAALDRLPPPRWPAPQGDWLIANLSDLGHAAVMLRGSGRRYALEQVTLHSPIVQPSKIMAAPANYRLHVIRDATDPAVHHGVHNVALEGVERPVEKFGLFLKASSSVVGPSDGIRLNWLDRRNDHEVELAVVIGKAGRNIPVDAAMDHVAGYTIGLDITVRGTEDRSFRKSADSYAVLGPWLVTRDEIDDPEALELWLEVNGEERQRSSTGAMTVGIRELIGLASRTYTLHPGDVILDGYAGRCRAAVGRRPDPCRLHSHRGHERRGLVLGAGLSPALTIALRGS